MWPAPTCRLTRTTLRGPRRTTTSHPVTVSDSGREFEYLRPRRCVRASPGVAGAAGRRVLGAHARVAQRDDPDAREQRRAQREEAEPRGFQRAPPLADLLAPRPHHRVAALTHGRRRRRDRRPVRIPGVVSDASTLIFSHISQRAVFHRRRKRRVGDSRSDAAAHGATLMSAAGGRSFPPRTWTVRTSTSRRMRRGYRAAHAARAYKTRATWASRR